MTRFTDRVTRDLHQIADRSTPSSTAWDSIRTRIDEQTDQPPTMEVIMLSPDRNDRPKRGWMLAAAAVAGLALVGGLVFATTRSDDTVPADTPVATLPAEPAPDAEVDPDAEAVVVPTPEPTTAAEVAPEPEPAPEPVTVTVTGTFAESGVSASATPTPSSAGLTGDTTILGTTIYEGQFAGSAPWVSQFWPLSDGSQFGAGEFLFTGTIEGLGSGTLSFIDVWQTVDGVWSDTSTITGGTGDFEGASGTGTSTSDPANPSSSATGSNVWTITVPPKGSLETVTATGTAVIGAQTSEPGERPDEIVSTETLTFEGSMVGTGQISQITWASGTTRVGSNTMEFTGTIDGLGTGTMTMLEVLTVGADGYTSSVTATGGTGDFEGITGTGTWKIADGIISYTFELTAPVNQ
jgi:hypothetical protein